MKPWNAVVLAGDRGENDPVASIANVSGKATVKLQHSTLLERVLGVLHQSSYINKIFTVGPSKACLSESPNLQEMLDRLDVTVIEQAEGPSASALRGIAVADYYPILLITCDLPLLEVRMLDDYCQKVESIDADVVVGAVDHSLIEAKIPELKKTKYNL